MSRCRTTQNDLIHVVKSQLIVLRRVQKENISMLSIYINNSDCSTFLNVYTSYECNITTTYTKNENCFFLHHNIDVIMTTMRLKSPALRLFTQPFIQTQIKENIKAPPHWPLCREFTGTDEVPAQRASYAENVSNWWRHRVIPGTYSVTRGELVAIVSQ